MLWYTWVTARFITVSSTLHHSSVTHHLVIAALRAVTLKISSYQLSYRVLSIFKHWQCYARSWSGHYHKHMEIWGKSFLLVFSCKSLVLQGENKWCSFVCMVQQAGGHRWIYHRHYNYQDIPTSTTVDVIKTMDANFNDKIASIQALNLAG